MFCVLNTHPFRWKLDEAAALIAAPAGADAAAASQAQRSEAAVRYKSPCLHKHANTCNNRPRCVKHHKLLSAYSLLITTFAQWCKKCTSGGFTVALQATAAEDKATDAQAQADLEAEGSTGCCLALAGPPPLHPGLHPCLLCQLVALLICLMTVTSTVMCMLS